MKISNNSVREFVKRFLPFYLFTLLPLTHACAGSEVKTYNNPVIKWSLPDPSVFKAADGYYYLYAT